MPPSTFWLVLLTTVGFGLAPLASAHSVGAGGPSGAELCPDKPIAESFADLACCFQPGRSPQHCLDDRVAEIAGDRTTRELLDAAERAGRADPELGLKCHAVAHAIGRAAFERSHDFAAAFQSCDQRCQAGCYHGVIERLFLSRRPSGDEGDHLTPDRLRGRIPSVCTAGNIGRADYGLLLQCYHGLGHAILYSLDYDLPSALRGCDRLRGDTPRYACYLGVFMENIITEERGKRWLKAGEPFYPCTAVGPRYRPACYKQSTKVMLHMRMSVAAVAEACREAGEFADECMEGLGRDTSPEARAGDARAVARVCADHAGRYLPDCIGGAVRALIDFTWDARYAYRYCAALPDTTGRAVCFRLGQSYLQHVYGQDATALREGCSSYATGALRECQQAVPTPGWWGRLFARLASLFVR